MKIYSVTGFWILCLALLWAGCDKDDDDNSNCITGEAPVVTDTFVLDPITKVSLVGSVDLNLTQNSVQSIVLTGFQNILGTIPRTVTNGTFRIGPDDNECWNDSNGIDAEIAASNIQGIDITGTGEVIWTDSFTVNQLTINVSGSGTTEMTGNATRQQLTVAGVADMDHRNVQSSTVEIVINGTADMVVWATDTLIVTINGTGDVRYRGNPSVLQETIIGIGSVTPL